MAGSRYSNLRRLPGPGYSLGRTDHHDCGISGTGRSRRASVSSRRPGAASWCAIRTPCTAATWTTPSSSARPRSPGRSGCRRSASISGASDGSAGAHDEGRGEQDDVRAALATLRAALPARIARPRGLLVRRLGRRAASPTRRPISTPSCLIAPPAEDVRLRAPSAPGRRDLLVVAVPRTRTVPIADLDAPRGDGCPRVRWRVIEGADHFFFGRLFPLGEAIRRWAEAWTARVSRRSRGRRAGVAVPADRMMRMPSSTVRPGRQHLVARQDDHVAEVQVVGGDEHRRPSRRLPSVLSTSTSPVTKPNTNSPLRGCSASTTALNALRFSGEKRLEELLDRRIDAAEDRHVREQPLDAREDAPAHDVGGDGAHEQDQAHRGEEAERRGCGGRTGAR